MLTIMTRSSAISKTERDLAFMRKYPFNKFDSSGLWDKTALPERRIALGVGALRTAGKACGGTCAAAMCGPRGMLDVPIGAERMPGVDAVCADGCAGAW